MEVHGRQRGKERSWHLTRCDVVVAKLTYDLTRPPNVAFCDMQTPASLYQSSSREMPNKLPPLEYSDRFEPRYVTANGGIRWNHKFVTAFQVCVGEYVGLEEIDNGVWNVYFGPLKLGRLLERHMRSEDAHGRLKRHNV